MKVFIGSSREVERALNQIAAVVEGLGHEPVTWTTPGIFPPSHQTFLSLVELSKTANAAILIFSEDDEVISRGQKYRQPRDNVLIEFGLFTGVLGTPNCAICELGSPKCSMDLKGLTRIKLDSFYRAKVELAEWLQSIETRRRRLPNERDVLVEDIMRALELYGYKQDLAGFREVAGRGHYVTENLIERLFVDDNKAIPVKSVFRFVNHYPIRALRDPLERHTTSGALFKGINAIPDEYCKAIDDRLRLEFLDRHPAMEYFFVPGDTIHIWLVIFDEQAALVYPKPVNRRLCSLSEGLFFNDPDAVNKWLALFEFIFEDAKRFALQHNQDPRLVLNTHMAVAEGTLVI